MRGYPRIKLAEAARCSISGIDERLFSILHRTSVVRLKSDKRHVYLATDFDRSRDVIAQ
jgi:hypothetical protein